MRTHCFSAHLCANGVWFRGFPLCIYICVVVTGLRRQYLVSEEARKICEVQKCSDEPRSWFIGDTVQTGM